MVAQSVTAAVIHIKNVIGGGAVVKDASKGIAVSNYSGDNKNKRRKRKRCSLDDEHSSDLSTTHTHVGTPPLGYNQGWVTHTVHFHDFESLSTERNKYVHSPEFECLGNQFGLSIYPGGIDGIDDDGIDDAYEGMVSLFLWNVSRKAIVIDLRLYANDCKPCDSLSGSSEFNHIGDSDCLGFPNFAERSKLLNSLVDGTLIIDVHMKLSIPVTCTPPPVIPMNPLLNLIQGLFLNEKTADIVFEVGGGNSKNNAMKMAKIEPIRFPAHRLIVSNCSSIFADLCVSEEGDDRTNIIEINDVVPDVFRLLLFYIYGGKVSNDDMKSHAKEIIDSADKYGVVNLKLEAEAHFVKGTTFTIENVMELLLYAESKNCALLKEAAIDFIVDNKSEVIDKISFDDMVPGTLVRDVLVATSRGEVTTTSNGVAVNNDSQYNIMRINELRKMAQEKGLNVDGSREMLIAALIAVQEVEADVSSEVSSEENSDDSDEEPEED